MAGVRSSMVFGIVDSIVLPQLRKRVAFACIVLHASMLILSVICQDYDIPLLGPSKGCFSWNSSERFSLVERELLVESSAANAPRWLLDRRLAIQYACSKTLMNGDDFANSTHTIASQYTYR
jgi:hypothetical protein